MMLRSKLLSLAFITTLFIAGCSGGGGNKMGIPGQPAAPTPQTASPAGTTPIQEQVATEKTTVDDCNGSITGTLTEAKTNLTAGDFKKANCIASQLFNASVTANPDKPDTQAAWIAFFAKLALLVETPEMNYLVGNTPPLKANDYFGPTGDIAKLGTLINDRWPNAVIPDFRGNLVIFLKMHVDMGHSVNNVFAKLNEFITVNFPDLHLLLAAMAKDYKFEIKDTDISNSKIFQLKWSSGDDATFTEAGIFDFWVNVFRVAANLAPRYDLGFSYESLAHPTLADLVTDMNTDPRFLTLIGNANANDAIPLVNTLFKSSIQGVKNAFAKTPQTWIGDLFPKDNKGQLEILTLTLDLQKSLEDNKMVPLSISHYKFAINVAKLLNQLPSSQGLSGNVVKLSGSGNLDLEDNFIKQFISTFTQEL